MKEGNNRRWYKEELIGNINCKFETKKCYDVFIKRQLEQLFYKLPLEIVISFYLCDMYVAFVEKVVKEENEMEEVAGMFQLGEGVIEIGMEEYQVEYAPFTIYLTFFHEFGHFVDFIMGKNLLYSCEGNFKEIADKEFKGLAATQICYYHTLILQLFGKKLSEKKIRDLYKSLEYFKDKAEYFA